MPISFNTNYFLRDGESLPPRSEGVLPCDDPHCQIVTFQYKERKVKKVISGIYDTSQVYDQGTTGKIYKIHVIDPKTGFAASHPQFVIKVMPVEEDKAKQEVACLQRMGFATLGNMEMGRSYIVMPYVEGISLEKLLKPSSFADASPEEVDYSSRLTFVDRLNILAQVMSLVQRLHQKVRLLHRDITLRNLLVRHRYDKIIADLVDFGEAVDIEEQNFSQEGNGQSLVLHYPAETLIDNKYDPASEIFGLAFIAAAVLGVVDPDEPKKLAYLHAKQMGSSLSEIKKAVVDAPLNLEELDEFTHWNDAEVTLDFHAIVKIFISRMQAMDAQNRPDIDEVARFFRYLHYIAEIKRYLSTPGLTEAEKNHFSIVATQKYASLLILLAAGKWKSELYDCGQVNFDSSFGFCHNVMTDKRLIEEVRMGRWVERGALNVSSWCN